MSFRLRVDAMLWTSPAGDAARGAAADVVRTLSALEEAFGLQGQAISRAGRPSTRPSSCWRAPPGPRRSRV